MTIFQRFIRAKKGMSTVFGALFFIILLLMGFNLFVWSFIQYDNYNQLVTAMGQRDQLALSENLENLGATDFDIPGRRFNITATNLGGTSVSIVRIYITNISPTGSTQCTTPNICIVDPSPSTTSYAFTNGNVKVGESDHRIRVTGLDIKSDGSGYKLILATSRGRLFSFFYPPPLPLPNEGQGVFQTNIGPLTIFFDFKSFNFTQGSETTSKGAWIVPVNTQVVFWVKVTNSATDSDVTLKVFSSLLFQPYDAGGLGASTPFYIVDKRSINPNTLFPYNEADSNSIYVLPKADPSGPGAFTVVKFGGSTQGSSTPQKFPTSPKTYLVFIGFYYIYQGRFQGQTIPFVAMRTGT